MVVWLSWLSGRALVARCILGSDPGDIAGQPLYLRYIISTSSVRQDGLAFRENPLSMGSLLME